MSWWSRSLKDLRLLAAEIMAMLKSPRSYPLTWTQISEEITPIVYSEMAERAERWSILAVTQNGEQVDTYWVHTQGIDGRQWLIEFRFVNGSWVHQETFPVQLRKGCLE